MDSNATTIDWRALLAREVAKAGEHGKTRVAARLGFSRAYVSRVMNPEGKSGLKNVPQTFIDRVINRFHVVECPVRSVDVPYSDCAKANQPAPSHNPLAVMVWRKCQTCPNKPAPGDTAPAGHKGDRK